MKNDPVIERLIRWPARDQPGQYTVRCSCLRWSFTGTPAEIEAASRTHDDSPRRNHIVSIYGRVIECPNDSASPASNSTTATPPEPCAAPNASQQPPHAATPAPTPHAAATDPRTRRSANGYSSNSSQASPAHDADNPSGPKTKPTSDTPTSNRDTADSNTPPATGQQAGKGHDDRHEA